MAQKPTTDQLLKLLENNLIGLWSTRQPNKPKRWHTTYTHQGQYYDTPSKPTPHQALQTTKTTLDKLQKQPPLHTKQITPPNQHQQKPKKTPPKKREKAGKTRKPSPGI